MIKAGIATYRILGGEVPSQLGRIAFDEKCSMCGKSLPEGEPCFRQAETKNIICLHCITEIGNELKYG